MSIEEFKKESDFRYAFKVAWRDCSLFYEDQTKSLTAFGGEVSPIDLVEAVIAYDVGENDSKDWICMVKLKDGRFANVHGGCDYTGWG